MIYTLISKGKKLFKSLDFFGAPINFNIDGKSSYKSALSGLVSSIMIICITTIFSFQIIVFLNRSKISVSVQEEFTADPRLIALNQNNILFVIGIEQLNTTAFNVRPFYNVTLTQNIYNQTSFERTYKDIPLQPCTIERFQEFQTAESDQIQDIFIQQNFDRYLCPPKNFSMNMKGDFLSEDFQFVQMKIKTCKNDTNNAYWNPICAPPEQVKDYLLKHNALRLTVYTTNYVVNAEKPGNITQIYMSNDLSFLFQPDVMVKQVNVNFRNYRVDTDNSLFITSNNQSQNWNYRDVGSSTIIQDQQNLGIVFQNQVSVTQMNDMKARSSLTINFRSDYLSMKAQRSFMKIDALFSYFGGIFQSFFLVLGIFMISYNQFFFKLHLANKLYEFEEITKTQPPRASAPYRNEGLVKNSTAISDIRDVNVENIELSDVMNGQKINELGFKSRGEFLIWYFERLLSQKKKLRITIDYILHNIFCGRFHQNKRNKLFDQAFCKVEADMNINHLLNQVIQVDKLKKLILTKHQMTLFNFFPKSAFNLSNKKNEFTSETLTDHHQKRQNTKLQIQKIIQTRQRHIGQGKASDDYNSFKKLLLAFDRITNTVSIDETTQQINKKLIFLLGYQVRQMFQALLLVEEQEHLNEGAPLNEGVSVLQQNSSPQKDDISNSSSIIKRDNIQTDQFPRQMQVIKIPIYIPDFNQDQREIP